MLRNTTAEDVAHVVSLMRPEDIRELYLASGKSAVEAIRDIGEKPYVSFTLCRDNEPVAIFGATLEPVTGVATMFRFATKRWPEVVREAVRFGRRTVLPMFKESGVKRIQAQALSDSDTKWLRLFGAKKTGGFVDDAGHHFHMFTLPLAD